MKIRRSQERGHADHGWLNSHHTFSFAHYMDPAHMGFRALRVINEDRVAPGHGFGTHAHRDMEIVSYVLKGEMAHKDSLGNVEIMRPGDVQRMSAGTGVRHSEYNASESDGLHFLQIWIEPDTLGLAPSYAQKAFAPASRQGQWRLVVSRDAREGSVGIHQDIDLYSGLFDGEVPALPARRHVWLHVVEGALELNGERLETGDAAALDPDEPREIGQAEGAHVLLFDLA
ncbi:MULTISPECIES: pirin family protein [unclassified Halomonas]|uniref:pirin family protein n=1 Tax=unclassified Halomonas TaxID=2609666 RepID=UPI00209F75EE|nr:MULTISPECIES: pirin family protein [unclassified Halomonas]MCP1314182.1 pirin family protein [Halomonas sp. 707D7]MCP1326489.1 pirin family protein [Halomonas sp. 707D4]